MSSSLTSTISASLTPEYDALWHKLHPLQHEMIITGVGRRVYPLLEYQFSGMNPEKMYTTSVHFEYVDDKKLRFCKGKYVESVSQEKKEAPRKVQHKSGAKLGSKWMASSVNFEDVRISNKKMREEEDSSNVHLHAQHRYLPVLTISEEGGSNYEIRLPHTVFITATLYHIDEVCKIKTESNEYAKSNREDRRRPRAAESSATSPPIKKSRKETPAHEEAVLVASVPAVLNSIPSIPTNDPVLLRTLPFSSAGLFTQTQSSSTIPAVQVVPPANSLNAFSAIPWLNPLNNPYLLAAMGLQFPTISFPYLPSTPYSPLTPTSSISPDSQPTQPEDPVNTVVIDKVIKEEADV
ncbi:Protein CBR-TBX-11 [Caenorhabditis briggsae]|uniref:Protein CBR-TBX-11 n=1 Tax=Caenorhabditis briggsae TaxID=6238 RepID=A8WJV8_CAEBR|nr:Protein CBR-TBX-11 [Caenorhabditis briggsae]CAP20751.1 Protein CBR-TBX-11 [Caenorhabditis briggsae]